MSEAQPVVWAILVLMIVAVAGLALSTIRVKGIGIGIVGVLFAGIFAGHFGLHIDDHYLEFVREFGLILFVFTIGLQLGPGFFDSFRKQGVKLNLMAIAIVLAGGILTVIAAFLVDKVAGVGLFCGATTNTPALGAAQQMLKTMGGQAADRVALPAIAYAVAYPGAIIGIISVMLILQKMFGINAEHEAVCFNREQKGDVQPLERAHLIVENSGCDGLFIGNILSRDIKAVISRIRYADTNTVVTATDKTILHRGDIVLVVGTRAALEKARTLIGSDVNIDLTRAQGRISSERMVVTQKKIVGCSIESLQLGALYGATITRVMRADLEMSPAPGLRLRFGDVLQIVVDEADTGKVASILGNRVKALHETNFLPIFAGILLGVFVGAIPISIPGLPAAVRMGIAGGPLILAIILSRIGRMGPLVWYMPPDANIAFRELGMTLFLACVGLKAGASFFSTVFTTVGFTWALCGFAITVLPLLLLGVIARLWFKLNYSVISGLIAGSMTDPPALAFANTMCKSDAPSAAYATVYPLTMLLRVFVAQILVLILLR